jgi:uracil-DNA glycosylase family 4
MIRGETLPPASAYAPEAPRNCMRCDRLVAFRQANKAAFPGWFNGAVPSFGMPDARLLIVGLAPGLKGANRTGRPFTGDYAGDLLYSTLSAFGFSSGNYEARPDDGLALVDCMISNSVRCVPPQNKPLPSEILECRGFLTARMKALPNLRAILVLGRIAHDQTLTTLGLRKTRYAFRHRARHEISDGLTMFDSLHCSRLNTNTRRLTTEMFHAVFADIRDLLGPAAPKA